jgi:hypothetical protein
MCIYGLGSSSYSKIQPASRNHWTPSKAKSNRKKANKPLVAGGTRGAGVAGVAAAPHRPRLLLPRLLLG